VLRILCELELVSYTAAGDGGPAWTLLDAVRTDLDRSPAHRAYAERFRAAEGAVGRPLPEPVQLAAAG
jgi:hypothetical protein